MRYHDLRKLNASSIFVDGAFLSLFLVLVFIVGSLVFISMEPHYIVLFHHDLLEHLVANCHKVFSKTLCAQYMSVFLYFVVVLLFKFEVEAILSESTQWCQPFLFQRILQVPTPVFDWCSLSQVFDVLGHSVEVGGGLFQQHCR